MLGFASISALEAAMGHELLWRLINICCCSMLSTLLKNMQLIYSDNRSFLFERTANLNSDKCEAQQIVQFQHVTVYNECCISVLNLFSCNLHVQHKTQAP